MSDGNVVPRLQDAESRLSTPGSGLYAAVSSDGGGTLLALAFVRGQPRGVRASAGVRARESSAT